MHERRLLLAISALFALGACGDPCAEGSPQLMIIDDVKGGDVVGSAKQLLMHIRTSNADPICEVNIGQLVANIGGSVKFESIQLYSRPDLSELSRLAEGVGGDNQVYYLVRSDNGFWVTLPPNSPVFDLYVAGDSRLLVGSAQAIIRGLLYKTNPSPRYDYILGTPRQTSYNLAGPSFVFKRQ